LAEWHFFEGQGFHVGGKIEPNKKEATKRRELRIEGCQVKRCKKRACRRELLNHNGFLLTKSKWGVKGGRV